jgi:hypothetical protein
VSDLDPVRPPGEFAFAEGGEPADGADEAIEVLCALRY